MNFHRSGWLQRYLDFRSAHPFAHQLPSSGVKVLESAGMHHELEESIYYFLQPTGLLYGFPIASPFPDLEYPGAAFQSATDRVHLSFLESLFACLVADRHFLLHELTDEVERLPPAVELARAYFEPRERPGLWQRLRQGVAPRRTAHAALEHSLRARIGGGTELFQLPGYYYNSFLFLDLHGCMAWQRRMLVDPDAAETHLAELAEEQRRTRDVLIRIMIAAADASGGVASAEKRLVSWFIRSSGLDAAHQARLREALRGGQVLEALEVPPLPWLVRRFILEATLMTLLVDRVLSPEEERFLERIVDVLQLWKEELTQSQLALEVFILHQESRLHIFRSRPVFVNVGANLREQAAIVIRRNLHRLVREIHETQELYGLLMKSSHTALSREEKRKVRQQLLDILKTIPALAIFALPGGTLILPVLIRLLPFNLLPSAFEDD